MNDDIEVDGGISIVCLLSVIRDRAGLDRRIDVIHSFVDSTLQIRFQSFN